MTTKTKTRAYKRKKTAPRIRKKPVIPVVEQRMCYYVSPTAFVPEHNGFLVWIVFENEPGYRLTGDWPCGPRGRMPYFWGPSLRDAEEAARVQNARLGLTEKDVVEIIGSSMRAERQPRARA